MSIGEIFFVGWSLLMLVVSIVFFIWARQSGQFKKVEKAKFDMLQEREPLPWPGRNGKFKDESQAEHTFDGNGGNV